MYVRRVEEELLYGGRQIKSVWIWGHRYIDRKHGTHTHPHDEYTKNGAAVVNTSHGLFLPWVLGFWVIPGGLLTNNLKNNSKPVFVLCGVR